MWLYRELVFWKIDTGTICEKYFLNWFEILSVFIDLYISRILFQIHPSNFTICQQTELLKVNKAYLWPRSKVWLQAPKASIQTAATKVTNMLYLSFWVLFVGNKHTPEFQLLKKPQPFEISLKSSSNLPSKINSSFSLTPNVQSTIT